VSVAIVPKCNADANKNHELKFFDELAPDRSRSELLGHRFAADWFGGTKNFKPS